MAVPTIAVIGGGFSGVIAAVHLLRSGRPLHVVLVNRSGPTARGVAYGTRSERHLLNVPAGRMSAFPDDEAHFLRFARSRIPGAAADACLPRRLYGEYLDQVLADAVRVSDARFTHVVAAALRIHPCAGGGARIELDDGTATRADRVILATGNFAPFVPRVPDADFFAASGRYVHDPWAPGALARVDAREGVLLIGTGLTMADVALELAARGACGPLLAVSRRGILPHALRPPATPTATSDVPAVLRAGPATARAYLRTLRRRARADAAAGADWRELVAALRPATPALWERLPVAERRRFLRHMQPYWDVHRHQLAPASAAALDRLLRDGRLVRRAARVTGAREENGRVRVTLRPRAAEAEVAVAVGAVINCTGPAASLRHIEDPLIRDLLERGLIWPDPLGIGVDTDGYALRDASGGVSDALFYTGPLLKGRLLEATAVPELRVHASRAAAWVLASLPAPAGVAAYARV